MSKKKARVHNEHFRSVSRKKCDCEEFGKRARGAQVFTWGEYHNVRWRTILHFCEHCFVKRVKGPLLDHIGGCGCQVELCYRGHFVGNQYVEQPAWLTLEDIPRLPV